MFSRNIQRTCFASRRCLIHTSPSVYNKASKSNTPHTTDSYSKDVDQNPPSDSTIHRVDPQSESVQKPHEPPSGEYSQAGTQTSEYQSVSHTQPYEVPGKDTRYGGKERLGKDKGPETSHPGDGPEGKEAGGRKPEGRS